VLLSKEFEKIGRELRASTMSEYTYYGFSPHISYLERGMDLFSGFFTDPLLASIDLEREIIVEEYLQELNGEGANVDINNHACRLLYKDTPLAMPIIGTEKNIRSITTQMLRDYFHRYYNPGNMVLVGAGCLSHERFLALAEQHFSKLQSHGTLVGKNHFQNTVPQNQTQPEFLFQYDSDSQVQLQICFRSFSYNHPDFFKISLINSIFDDGISSRLQRSLREERALVYSVECRATSLSDVGTFDFDVSVRPEKTCKVTEILFQEIKTFLEFGPTQDEMEHEKKRYFFDLEFDLDDPCKQILRHGFSQLYASEISLDEERAIIEKITAQDLLETARRVFLSKNLNVVVVGPYTSEMKKELEALARSF
jgi:predicted Zn-dependent peptidase